MPSPRVTPAGPTGGLTPLWAGALGRGGRVHSLAEATRACVCEAGLVSGSVLICTFPAPLPQPQIIDDEEGKPRGASDG